MVHLLAKKVDGTNLVVNSKPSPSILFQHFLDPFRLKVSTEGFIWSRKDDPIHPVELLEFHGRWGIDGYQSNDGRLDFRRRPEIVPRNIHNVVDFCEELNVSGETRPKGSPWSGD